MSSLFQVAENGKCRRITLELISFPSPGYLSVRFPRQFFFLFPPMRNLVSSYSAPYRFLLQSPSLFLFFWSRLSNFSTNSTGDACYAAEKLMVRRNLHYHLKKYENGARHCIFNLVHLIAHQTLAPFFIKTFCCRRLLSYHFVMVLLSSHYLSRPVCLC